MANDRPFTRMSLEEEGKSIDSFTVRLNKEERIQLEADKQILQQTKDSTAIKQLAAIGSKVIHSQETKEILEIVQGNKRRNKRLNIVDFE